VLLRQVWHLSEDELSGERPKEGLDWKLVHIGELETKCNVVVLLNSFDFTPKAELFSFNFGLKSVQRHFNLHALIKVQGRTVVSEIFDFLGKIKDVHICLFLILYLPFQFLPLS